MSSYRHCDLFFWRGKEFIVLAQRNACGSSNQYKLQMSTFLWTSYTTEDLLGQPMRAMLSYSKAEVNPHPWEEGPMFATLTTGAVHQHEEDVLWRKDGTHVPVKYISTP